MDNEFGFDYNNSKYVVKYKDISGEYFSSFQAEVTEAQKIYDYLLLREDKRRVALIDLEKGEIIKSYKISSDYLKESSKKAS